VDNSRASERLVGRRPGVAPAITARPPSTPARVVLSPLTGSRRLAVLDLVDIDQNGRDRHDHPEDQQDQAHARDANQETDHQLPEPALHC
jgi:hypothetical protein